MNSTTLRRLRPLLSACLLLASLVALHAANWQTLPLQLTAPGWAAHEFELSLNGMPHGAVVNHGLVELYRGSSSANGVSLTVTLDVDAGSWFSLWDSTTGGGTVVVSGLDSGTWRIYQYNSIVPIAGFPPTLYLLVPEERRDHPLAVVQPDGLNYSVSVLAGSPMTYSSPSTGLSYTAYEGHSGVDPSRSFSVIDLQTYERTADGQADLTLADWTPDYSLRPLVAETVWLEGRELGHRFTVHSRVPGGPELAASVVATVAGQIEAQLNFSVGLGMRFWLTRDADGWPAPGNGETPWVPANNDSPWIADPNGSSSWSAYGIFPENPQRSTPLEPRTFRINAQRWGHEFTVLMSDGYRSRFVPANPSFLALGEQPGAGQYGWGQVEDWNDMGIQNPLAVIAFTAQIDPTRAWWLRDETAGEEYPVSQTDILDGWVPLHAAPPPNPTITLHLPATRANQTFDLDLSSFGFSMMGWLPFQTGVASETQSYEGADGMAPYEIAGFSLTIPNPMPYSGGPFRILVDTHLGGTIADHDIVAGDNDLRRWFVEPRPLYLSISSSRWGHELLLRHPNGEAFPILPDMTAFDASLGPNQIISINNYYYFNATTSNRPELPLYVEDASTGERIGPNPSNDTLITWFALPAPAGLTGLVNATTGAITLQWPLGSAATEGGFEVERQLTGESTWQTIGTLPANTADLADVLHFSDPNPVAGRVHYYRVRYTYGAGPDFRHSAPSNPVALSEWQDDDGDGMPDWWEDKHGLDRGARGDATGDADGDGVSNLDEYLAGSDPTDPLSCPYKVTSCTPDDEQHGHDTNGVILLYLNKPLPAAMTTLPAGIVTHTADGGATWQAVLGTAMVLPGGKGVAFVPTADFIPHAAGVSQATYRLDFTAATTGLAPVVPFHIRFSVEDPDPVGPWVKQTWPGDDHTEVAVDFAPVVQWSEPLHADTLLAANVSLRPEGGTADLPVTVTFDYATNRLTIAPAALLQPDTVYHAALSSGFKNLMGLPLLDVYRWSFQTRPIPPPPPPGTPHVATSDPQPYATNLPVDTAFTFTFSEDMDSTTLTDQTMLLRAFGSPDDVPVQIDYPVTGVLTVTPTAALSPGTRYVLAMDENVIQSAATPPKLLGGLTRFPFATASSGGGGPGGGPGGPGGSPEPGKPKPVKITVSYGSSGSTDQQGGYAMAEITKPDGSKTTQKGDKLNAPNKASATFTIEAEDGSTIKVTPKKVIASAALAAATTAPAGAGAAPETEFGGENYVIFKQTGTSDEWVYEGKASIGVTVDSKAHEVGHFFAPIFDSKDYSRGFDPPVREVVTGGAPYHDDYKTSVCATTAVNPSLAPGPLGQQDLNINDHISVKFQNLQIAQNCEVVIKKEDKDKISFNPALPAVLAVENLLSIRGIAEGAAEIHVYAKRQQDGAAGSARTRLATLTVDVLPPVTLTLGIWIVSDSTNPDSVFAMTAAETDNIFKRTNKAFRSACIIFNPVLGAQGPALNVPFDISFNTPYGMVGRNGFLNLEIALPMPLHESPESATVKTWLQAAVSGVRADARIVLVKQLSDHPKFPGGITNLGDPLSYVAADPALFLPDNPADKLQLTCAHEVGHQLGLSTLNTPGQGGANHDPGPFPTDPNKKKWFGLMKVGGGFEWLRQEDWKAANIKANAKSK